MTMRSLEPSNTGCSRIRQRHVLASIVAISMIATSAFAATLPSRDPLDAVLEIATDDLPLATAALSVPAADPAAYDVLIYFAHRIPNGAGATQAQEDFVAAVDAFLVAGGGVVSFHHGSYASAGKESMLELIGGTASGAVPWNTVDGQNAIDVAPGHFVTTNAVDYSSTTMYADAARGVPAGSFRPASRASWPARRRPPYSSTRAIRPVASRRSSAT